MKERTTEIDGKRIRCTLFDSQHEARTLTRSAVEQRDRWRKEWVGIDREGAYKRFETGDNSLVPASDEMISKLEGKFDFPTSRYSVFDDVAGGVPNVPAMLANQPLNMRVRRRVADEAAPLTICIDLTSSAVIGAPYLLKRGAAILALARILSGTRPVNIWLGAGLSEGRGTAGSTAWFQLDAAPLDLARAAFQISSASVPRGMLYAYLHEANGCGGGFPMRDVDKWRRMAPMFLAQWFEGEIMFVPPVFAEDDFKNPDVWLEQMVKQYGGRDQE